MIKWSIVQFQQVFCVFLGNLQHSGTIELSEMTDVISELFEMSGQNRTEGDKHSPHPQTCKID